MKTNDTWKTSGCRDPGDPVEHARFLADTLETVASYYEVGAVYSPTLALFARMKVSLAFLP